MVNSLKNLSEDASEFIDFCEYLQQLSGITIAPGKTYLINARIRQILVDYELKSLRQLIQRLKGGDRKLKQSVIDAMTTNETFWFRDGYPFDYFANVLLPKWSKEKQYEHRPIRIWSAACSSGQEPYSLAMLIEEYKAKNPLSKKIEIVATDLSSKILDQAKLGEYDHLSIGRGLSPERLNQYFTTSCQKKWTIKSTVSQHIQFKSINLLEPYSNLGRFDMIFCRNVLIYFTKETKNDILQRMHQTLNKNGLLCLGSSEGLNDASSLYEMHNCNPGLLYLAK